MKKICMAASMVLALIVVFASIPVEAAVTDGILKTTRLWAAAPSGLRGGLFRGTHVGSVTVAIEGENLVVIYTTRDGWELTETHLYASTVMPKKWAPGRFPYKHENLSGVTFDPYYIPLAELGVECGDTVYIAAHAVVQKWKDECWWEETAWAGVLCGCPFSGGWGAFVWVTIPCTDS